MKPTHEEMTSHGVSFFHYCIRNAVLDNAKFYVYLACSLLSSKHLTLWCLLGHSWNMLEIMLFVYVPPEDTVGVI